MPTSTRPLQTLRPPSRAQRPPPLVDSLLARLVVGVVEQDHLLLGHLLGQLVERPHRDDERLAVLLAQGLLPGGKPVGAQVAFLGGDGHVVPFPVGLAVTPWAVVGQLDAPLVLGHVEAFLAAHFA